jgi:hypothetical protein
MKDEDIDFAIIPELTGDERFFVGSFTDDQAGGCPKKYQ